MTMFHVLPGDCAGCSVVSLGFCAGLDRRSFDRIAAAARTVRYRRSQFVEPGSDAVLPALILRRGLIKLSQTLIDGRQQIVDFLTEGDVLVCLRSDAGSAQMAEAMSDTEACEIDLADISRIEAAAPGITETLLTAALSEIGRKNRQVMMLGRKRSDERVATFLLDCSARAARRGDAGGRVRLPISRADIADYLSLTTETVSRAFSVLREEGLIHLPRPDEVELRDLPGLARVAGGGAKLSVR